MRKATMAENASEWKGKRLGETVALEEMDLSSVGEATAWGSFRERSNG